MFIAASGNHYRRITSPIASASLARRRHSSRYGGSRRRRRYSTPIIIIICFLPSHLFPIQLGIRSILNPVFSIYSAVCFGWQVILLAILISSCRYFAAIPIPFISRHRAVQPPAIRRHNSIRRYHQQFQFQFHPSQIQPGRAGGGSPPLPGIVRHSFITAPGLPGSTTGSTPGPHRVANTGLVTGGHTSPHAGIVRPTVYHRSPGQHRHRRQHQPGIGQHRTPAGPCRRTFITVNNYFSRQAIRSTPGPQRHATPTGAAIASSPAMSPYIAISLRIHRL